MITCLAIGATSLAFPLALITLLIPFARNVKFRCRGKAVFEPERLGAFMFMMAFTSPVCGLAVWLWQKALAS